MSTAPQPPFSARVKAQHRQIDADFPDTARTGLLHLLSDLVEREYVSGWIVLARELQRIARKSLTSYSSTSVRSIQQASVDVRAIVNSVEWPKIYDFCERLHGHLPNEIGWEDNFGNYIVRIARSDAQAYMAAEIQRLFLEEGLAYEFSDGIVRRRGRKHTVEMAAKSQVVLGDPKLLGARRHFDKALVFFRHPSKPDFENSVKEAVCAVEATAKTLFPMAKSSTLGEFIKWLEKTNEVLVPKAVCQTLNGVYGFRNGGERVAHGGATGGKATPEICEYILGVCASQIILLVDLSNGMEVDVPF